jgi:hypothetical protein
MATHSEFRSRNLAVLIFIVACLATILEGQAVSSERCAVYHPKTCLYSDAVSFSNRQCHPQPCDFNVSAEFECGFVETGIYSYLDTKENCNDAFMSTKSGNPSPCGMRCCRSDHESGVFEVNMVKGLTSFTFQPSDNECRYESLSRSQVLRYLGSRGSRLVVIGDSMMRQLFLRLVFMMRGQQRLLDYHLHTHAQYLVCNEADAFRLAIGSPNTSRASVDVEYLGQTGNRFFRMTFGPGKEAARFALQACTTGPVVKFEYLHSPEWQDQLHAVPPYLNGLSPGERPVLVISVGYWERSAEVPQDYLDMLARIKSSQARKIFIVSIPTIRVPSADRREAYRLRNERMRGWVEAAGEPFVFLDFDAMSHAKAPPPGGSLNNWHYMCSVAWRTSCPRNQEHCGLVVVDHSRTSVNASTSSGFNSQIPRGLVERIHATDDGLCGDEMNRNVWQVVFNTLLKPGTAGFE